MNEREIVRLVADRFLDDTVRIPDEGLPEPWQTIWYRIGEAWVGSRTVRDAVQYACRDLPHSMALARAILRAMPSDTEYQSLADLAPSLPPIRWLWQKWIPRGMLSLLGASPGAGKSLVALDLCRRILHGEPWPDGQEIGETAGQACIYVDAEGVPQLLNERAEGWGMDSRRLYLMLPGDFAPVDLMDAEQQDRLVDMCGALSPALVVIDSLSTISLRGENSVEDVRLLLSFLGHLSRQFECGCMLIHHLRKKASVLPMIDLVGPEDFRGSTHITAMARSVLALSVIRTGEEVNRNGPRRLEVVKTNLCEYAPALGLEFLRKGGASAPRLVYGAPPQAYREPSEAEECAGWLRALLEEEGELAPGRVVEMAGDEGWGRSTVYKAREILGDELEDVGPSGRGRRWRLAGTGG